MCVCSMLDVHSHPCLDNWAVAQWLLSRMYVCACIYIYMDPCISMCVCVVWLMLPLMLASQNGLWRRWRLPKCRRRRKTRRHHARMASERQYFRNRRNFDKVWFGSGYVGDVACVCECVCVYILRVYGKSGYKRIEMHGTYHGQLQTLCIPY